MYNKCEQCGFDFHNETGFYWFAMYVSYILCAAISITNFIIFSLVFGFLNYAIEFIIINSIFLIILMPFIFRWSRAISLYITIFLDKKS